jgi:hypothetical protein
MSQQDSLKQSKINIDSDEKLVAYNNFHDYARKLTEESIKINALAKQVNFNLCCIVRRRKILEAKKKCIDEFALNVYGEEGPKIFSSDIVVDPSIPNLDLNYKYNATFNILHLENEDPSMLGTPSTPISIDYEEEDDKWLSKVDLTQTQKSVSKSLPSSQNGNSNKKLRI